MPLLFGQGLFSGAQVHFKWLSDERPQYAVDPRRAATICCAGNPKAFEFKSTMAQYVFTMNRVGKIIPPKRAILKDISLSFFPGAKIGVLGLNGSGKSTLLKIMAGLDKDIEGEAVPMPGLKIGYLE